MASSFGGDTRCAFDDTKRLADVAHGIWDGLYCTGDVVGTWVRVSVRVQRRLTHSRFNGDYSTANKTLELSRDYETSNSLDPQEGSAEVSCPAFKRAESAESAGKLSCRGL